MIMEKNGTYSTETGRSFAETRKRVEEKAALEGFRVLHIHDVQATLREKGFEAEPTLVIEVCNAALASEALKLDPKAALSMPCKVVVQEIGGKVTLSTLLPEALVEGEALRAMARQVGVKLISLVDTAARSVPGRLRYALLANRVEIEAARRGQATATRLYRDEEGRLRLSALAPLPSAPGRGAAFVGVDATPEFVSALDSLRQQMALLGGAGLLTVGAAGFVLVRQVSRRLNRLRDVVSRVSRGDFAGRVGFAGRDEIGALGQDLDGMVGSLVAVRDYYEAVLASADVGLLTTDRHGRILGANPRALALLAPAAPAVVGRPL